MRILGLDYGSKTVGVAVSDPFGWTAQGVEIIRRDNEKRLRKTYARIDEIIKEYGVTEIIWVTQSCCREMKVKGLKNVRFSRKDLRREPNFP